jgi:prevent-host-death family protein
MQMWQMQEAKARLSEVVKCAETQGPQTITVHGQSVAVLMSHAMFEKLTGNHKSLLSFMRASPLYAMEDVPLERDKSPTRKVLL